MATSRAALSSAQSSPSSIHNKEGWGRVVYYSCTTAILAVMLALFVMLCAGDEFSDVLAAIGLYHEPGGVYTNCSVESNRFSHKFCQPKQSQQEHTWKTVDSKMPFSLSGR